MAQICHTLPVKKCDKERRNCQQGGVPVFQQMAPTAACLFVALQYFSLAPDA